MTPVSAPLWELLPIAALIQFPWRLLALTAVTLAVLSGPGHLRQRPRSRGHATPVLVLALVAVLASFPYTLPQYTPIPDSAEGPLLTIEFELEYTDMRGMTAWTQEMPPDSPLVDQYLAGETLVTAEALAPGATVEMIRAGGASDELWVRSPDGHGPALLHLLFPRLARLRRRRAPARLGAAARDGLRPADGGHPAGRAPRPAALGRYAAAAAGQSADPGLSGVGAGAGLCPGGCLANGQLSDIMAATRLESESG